MFDSLPSSFLNSAKKFKNKNYIKIEFSASLKHGIFHNKITQQFQPMVTRYTDLMEHSIAQSIEKGFSKEKWEPRKLVFFS